MKPKVTILMPCYNTRDDWLKIAIRCAAQQTYENLDVRIGDDGSTKASTLEALKWAEETWPDRVFVHRRTENGGSARGLNEALWHSDKDTVYFSKFDSDDLCHPDREKNRVNLFETLPPQVAIVYDNIYHMVYYPRPYLMPVIGQPYNYRLLLETNFIFGNAMYRANVYDKIPKDFVFDGYDNPKGCNRHCEDYWLWLAITDYWDGFWFNQDPAFTTTYRDYQDSKYHRDKRGVDYSRAFCQQRAKERRGLL